MLKLVICKTYKPFRTTYTQNTQIKLASQELREKTLEVRLK